MVLPVYSKKEKVAGITVTTGAIAVGVGITALKVAAFAQTLFTIIVGTIVFPVIPTILTTAGTFALLIGIGLAIRCYRHRGVRLIPSTNHLKQWEESSFWPNTSFRNHRSLTV